MTDSQSSPSTSPYADDLTLALALADAADTITMARFEATDLQVESKPDLTPVSDADTAVEKEIRSMLSTHRSEDSVLGEEFGGDVTLTGRQWVIDPIDGTKNFVRGVPVGYVDQSASRRQAGFGHGQRTSPVPPLVGS